MAKKDDSKHANGSLKKPLKWKKLDSRGEFLEWEDGQARDFKEYLGFTPSEKEDSSGIHRFKQFDGTVVAQYDCATLHRQLVEDPYPIGQPVRLEFNGLKKAKRGGKYKDFQVYAPQTEEVEG
jgi:hypothetical protein